jgi:UDP-N-acetylglucosamine pyrophosphorylase
MFSSFNINESVKFIYESAFWGVDYLTTFPFEQGLSAGGKPDGHGGLFEAAAKSGFLSYALSRGIQHFNIVPIDNVLAPVSDPDFQDNHIAGGYDVSLKVVFRESVDEPCSALADTPAGKPPAVVEWRTLMDQPNTPIAKAAHAPYGFGVTNMMMLSATFFQTCCKNFSRYAPFRSIPGDSRVQERFLFDVISHAKKVQTVLVDRDKQFYPIKNKTGKYSLEEANKLFTYVKG